MNALGLETQIRTKENDKILKTKRQGYFLLWAIFYFHDRNRRKIPTRQIKLTSQKASIVAQVLNCLFVSFLFAATSNSE